MLAIGHARTEHGVGRIAVIDWDVHHGNGTQLVFYRDSSVLTISLHQDGYYPADSGAIIETGSGDGEGANVNIPLPPGSGHGAYIVAFDRVVVPAVDRFRPDLIVVASGYDAAMGDPLGRMLCHSDTFRAMTDRALALAREHCGGQLVVCQEGGYSPSYVPFCGLAVLKELAGVRTEVRDPMLGWYSRIPGQELQPHQERVIASAAEAVRAAATRRASCTLDHRRALRAQNRRSLAGQ